ncbi:MAG: ThuA domain-containing protein [Bacteroidales bacterium]|nr:ThuA domain-containing protein [Bacteroidales bacterium]
MKRTLIRLIILSLIFSVNLIAQDAPSLKGKHVLFTYGGWDGHEPVKCIELLKPWMEQEGAQVDTFTNLDIYADEEYMKTVDLVVQIVTMSKITEEQENGLLRAIKNGTGIAGWHGGMGDAFRENVEYQFMTGGQWVAHPGGIIKEYNLSITDKEDLVTAGINDFKMKNTEQYYMHVDPNVKVLAITTFTGEHADWIKGCTMPVVWKKMYGKGRVFYTSLGHVVKDLEVSEVNTILKRGIRWASESKYAPSETWISPVYKK